MATAKQRQVALEQEVLELKGEVLLHSQISAMILANIICSSPRYEELLADITAAVDEICQQPIQELARGSASDKAKARLAYGQSQAGKRILKSVERNIASLRH